MTYRVLQGFKSYVAIDLEDLKRCVANGEIKPVGFVHGEDGSRSQLVKMPELKESIKQYQALISAKTEGRLKISDSKAGVIIGGGFILLMFYGLLRPPTEAERAEQERAEYKARSECLQKIGEKYDADTPVTYEMINEAGKCR